MNSCRVLRIRLPPLPLTIFITHLRLKGCDDNRTVSVEAKPRIVIHFITESGRDPFNEWMERLQNKIGRAVILSRIDRVSKGNFGDHRFVGEGVSELRITVLDTASIMVRWALKSFFYVSATKALKMLI